MHRRIIPPAGSSGRIGQRQTVAPALPGPPQRRLQALRGGQTFSRLFIPSQSGSVEFPLGQTLAEATAMARVFPLLYVLENSIRELIKRVMSAKFGEDWWNTELNKGKLKNVHQKAETRMLSEKKSSWHQKRGAHPSNT
jgi:hypothetical protein